MKKLIATMVLGTFLSVSSGLSLVQPTQAWAQPGQTSQDLSKLPKPPHFAEAAWWLEGAGALIMTGGIVALVFGYGAYSDRRLLLEQNANGDRTEELAALEQTGSILTTMGWIAIGVSVATITAGTIWLLTATTKPASASKSPPTASHTPPTQATFTLFQSAP